jgi:hypothetical protein
MWEKRGRNELEFWRNEAARGASVGRREVAARSGGGGEWCPGDLDLGPLDISCAKGPENWGVLKVARAAKKAWSARFFHRLGCSRS